MKPYDPALRILGDSTLLSPLPSIHPLSALYSAQVGLFSPPGSVRAGRRTGRQSDDPCGLLWCVRLASVRRVPLRVYRERLVDLSSPGCQPCPRGRQVGPELRSFISRLLGSAPPPTPNPPVTRHTPARGAAIDDIQDHNDRPKTSFAARQLQPM